MNELDGWAGRQIILLIINRSFSATSKCRLVAYCDQSACQGHRLLQVPAPAIEQTVLKAKVLETGRAYRHRRNAQDIIHS